MDVAFPILEHATLQCLAFILGSYTCSRCYLLKSSCHKCDLCFNSMCNVQGMHTILVWKVVITKSKMTKYPKDVKLSLSYPLWNIIKILCLMGELRKHVISIDAFFTRMIFRIFSNNDNVQMPTFICCPMTAKVVHLMHNFSFY